MRFLYAVLILVLISIASSYLVRELGFFAGIEPKGVLDPAVFFVSEPTFRLDCGDDTSPQRFRDVISGLSGSRPLSRACSEMLL